MLAREINNFKDYTVMIIDDDDYYRRLLKIIVEKTFECKVLEAEDPKRGFEMFTNYIPDVIILDMKMPKMDGQTALSYLRAHNKTEQIPVVVCSAMSAREAVENLVKLNISAYIVKPSETDIIKEKIAKGLKDSPKYKARLDS
ncbi:MAG: response regulator [Chloroflexota bacterium]